jgi:hypothetical protein
MPSLQRSMSAAWRSPQEWRTLIGECESLSLRLLARTRNGENASNTNSEPGNRARNVRTSRRTCASSKYINTRARNGVRELGTNPRRRRLRVCPARREHLDLVDGWAAGALEKDLALTRLPRKAAALGPPEQLDATPPAPAVSFAAIELTHGFGHGVNWCHIGMELLVLPPAFDEWRNQGNTHLVGHDMIHPIWRTTARVDHTM